MPEPLRATKEPFLSLAADHAESGDSHVAFFVAAVVGSLAAHFLFGYFAGEARIDLVRVSDAPNVRQRLALREESAVSARVVPPEELPPALRDAEKALRELAEADVALEGEPVVAA